MSTFFTQTNHGRVAKMLELMGHLETSARSNNATPEDWTRLLQPLTDRMAGLTATPDQAAPAATQAPTASHWINAIHFAREVPIRNAAAAIQILATRLEEHLDDQGKGAE